ncbi:MAG: DNA polymerase I [Deltaproteobacteria bacterium RIFOXYB12_FULL_58_9]|nr:MAG: DNA polymerase I [Deltaproteobacteria bacterium RIFOXYB12_FULL_58_9]
MIYLVDGSGYIFRAFYAVRPLTTSKGVPTNAVTGFARMIGKLMREEDPQYLGIAFDGPEKTFRHEIYSEYKANREAPPEDLVPQFGLIRELVAAMDVPVLIKEGYEADDVIATLARKGEEAGHEVVIVTGDKDLMQLVTPMVSLYDPMHDRRIGADQVMEKFGVPPGLVADAQALAGDSSDNIPGVPKVGLKSAAKLISTFGDIEAVIAGVQTIAKPKAYERSVMEHADNARLSKRLTVLDTHVAVDLDLKELTHREADPAKLGDFLRKVEAFSLLREFALHGEPPPLTLQPAVDAIKPVAQPLTIDRSTYRTILNFFDLEVEIDAARHAKGVSFDLETTSIDATRAEIVGMSMCVAGRPAVYVPVAHRYLGMPAQLPLEEVLRRLRPLLEDAAICKFGQNLKYDYIVLSRAGVTLRSICDDAMVAAHVLDPSRASFSLDTLAREFLGHQTIRYSDVTGTGKNKISFDEVTVDDATAYAGEDADVALRLCEHLRTQVKDAELDSLYRELELPLVPVLAKMESAGILVDVDHLRRLSREFTERLSAIEKRARDMIGEPINLASPKQLARLFFEKLKYPVVKRTPTGYSTDQEVLEILAQDHELPGVVLEHRLLAKLKSTYLDSLPKMVNPHTGRVHTSFNQTGTATGRLSSSDPNLQNIPIRGEDGRRIREAFIAKKGCQLVAADYSQIELRIMAHLSRDEAFVAAFKQGQDIHERTAREVLTDGDLPTPDQRRQAKAINFGILYGLSEFGLGRQLGISRSEAGSYIARYFGRYPSIREFLDQTIEEGRARGYVTTVSGRRRFLPDLRSKNRTVRQAAERVAMNTPIQGSAADLIKMAMLRVSAALDKRRLAARLLLQVHDELVLEVPDHERDEVVALVKDEMGGVMALAVPLLVDVGCGSNWATAH